MGVMEGDHEVMEHEQWGVNKVRVIEKMCVDLCVCKVGGLTKLGLLKKCVWIYVYVK